MLAFAADGAVASWAGRIGKITVLIAGLAILLDLIGPDRISRWADSAAEEKKRIAERLRYLREIRRLMRLVRTIANHAATGVTLATDYFTAAEFVAFARKERAAFLDRNPFYRRFPADPGYVAGALEKPAYDFLIERLPDNERAPFEHFHREFSGWARRSLQISGALFVLVIPVTIWLFLQTDEPHQNDAVGALVIFTCVCGYVLFISAALLSRRVRLTFLWTVTAVRSLLARAAQVLVGPNKNAHPLRWAGLVAFLAGSLLDLLASW